MINLLLNKLKLSQKILVFFIFTVSISVLITSTFSLYYFLNISMRNFTNQLQEKTNKARQIYENRRFEMEQIVSSYSVNNIFINNINTINYDSTLKQFDEILNSKNLSFIAILDQNGNILVSSDKSDFIKTKINILSKKQIEKILQSGIFSFITNDINFYNDDKNIITLVSVSPIIDFNHGFLGLIIAGEYLKNLDKDNSSFTLADIRKNTATSLIITDKKQIISSSDNIENINLKTKFIEKIDRTKKYKLNLNKTLYLFNFLPLYDFNDNFFGNFGIGFPLTEYLSIKDRAILGFILIIFLTSIISVFLSYRFSKSITNPIIEMANGTRNIINGNYDCKIIVNSKDELGFLADEFNIMTQKLKETLTALKKEINEKEEAQSEIIDLNNELEDKVKERTLQLENINIQLQESIKNLKLTQNYLIESEKMASLGQLVAGIAHEINTPLGAIKSSNENALSIMSNFIPRFPELILSLSPDELNFFMELYKRILIVDLTFSNTKEIRTLKKQIISTLEEYQIENPEFIADELVELGIKEDFVKILPLLKKKKYVELLHTVKKISWLYASNRIIKISLEKSSKVINALKMYSYHNTPGAFVHTNIISEIEILLTLYYNKYKHGVEIIKNFSNIPLVNCIPDRLEQVWINILNNALQAINYNGKIEISISAENNYVNVSISNNGAEIPEDVKNHIFTPFFTTKKMGEGTGIGLYFCKKIVEEHNGKIFFDSKRDKTTFSVLLPL
jgi:signal transduction histidine kinase